MNITFQPLQTSHFPLLLKWLETRHVKAWWDQDVVWTPKLIQEKFGSYAQGYKLENGESKEMRAYIIYVDTTPVGYIQLYNAYDFPRSAPLSELPESMAAFDMFIGEGNYLKKGIGSLALKTFLEEFVDKTYNFTFADPDMANVAAIKTYEKAGFRKYREKPELGEIWMLRSKHGKIIEDGKAH